ncbi:MAG: formaldehyde-activating enzyme [Solirubrobacteraceae bacterium]
MIDIDKLDGTFAEAFAGNSPDGVHINLVVGRRGGPTAAAAAVTLTSPAPGHVPFLACLRLGTAVRPATIVTNKTTIEDDTLGRLTWGAAQLGIAEAVLDSLAESVVDLSLVDNLVFLVALWLDPAASDETAVRAAAHDAMHLAIARAVALSTGSDDIQALIADRRNAGNGFYTGR